jgi:hypothetical protein
VRLTTSFATGNGVISVGGGGVVGGDNAVVLDTDLRDSVGERWYWHLSATAAADTELRIRMAKPLLIGRFGPAVRTVADYGWLWRSEAPDTGFDLRITAGTTVWASATLPYGMANLRTFRDSLGKDLSGTTLATSEGGRGVPLLRSGSGSADRVIVLTCRHHACEATASYVLEGAVGGFVERARRDDRIARRCELIAAPLMDVDGVQRGDQGKARTPWDHNRDYGPSSRYRAVAALRAMLATEDRPIYALDLHTPGLRGELEERPYVVISAERRDADTAGHLLTLLNTSAPGHACRGVRPLVFDHAWNTASSTGQRCCAAWLRSVPATRLATTIEYPNAVDQGLPVTAARARAFGAALMDALLTITT